MSSTEKAVAAEKTKTWRQKNRVRAKETAKRASARWRERNPEREAEAARAYYHQNKERQIKLKQAWYAANPEKSRNAMLLRVYGITIGEYNAMLDRCGSACEICGKGHVEESKKRLVVDHCHATGKIRGLICSPCNRAIGHLGDCADSLMKAVEYLRRAGGP